MMDSNLNRKEKIVLSGIIEEFRQALDAEIEAIKKNSTSGAVPLTNGRKISESGNEHQYKFSVDSTINLPDGSPAKLVIDSNSYEVSIVSFEGQYIIISSSKHHGDFIGYAKLESDSSALMMKLIERIEANYTVPNSAGERMLGREKVVGSPIDKEFLKTNVSELNVKQQEAVKSALGRNLTYIWGPPGTGKTKTIGKIIEELFRNERTVLIVSHTNTAVDGAIKEVCDSLTEEELNNCSVLRLGKPKDNELKQQVFEKYHIEVMSKELTIELDRYEKIEKETLIDIGILKKQIADYNWLNHYETDIIEKTHLIRNRKNIILQCNEFDNMLKLKIQKTNELKLKLSTSGDYFHFDMLLKESVKNKKILLQKMDTSAQKLEDLHLELETCKNNIINHTRINELKADKSILLSETSQRTLINNARLGINSLEQDIATQSLQLEKLNDMFKLSEKNNFVNRLLKGLKSPEELRNNINEITQTLKQNKVELEAKKTVAYKYIKNYKRTMALSEELKSLNVVSTPIELEKKVVVINDKITKLQNNMKQTKLDFDKETENSFAISNQFEKVKSTLNFIPEELLQKIDLDEKDIDDIKRELSQLQFKLKEIDNNMIEFFQTNDVYKEDEEYDKMLDDIEKKATLLRRSLFLFDLEERNQNVEELSKSLEETIKIIKEIKIKLDEIVRKIIANAKIIGTTLTKAYLSDDLQKRKFDTIILDEASMASIPALWATAYMAEKNIIIVGDFKQLPPIVISKKEIAIKWIGEDVFCQSGVKTQWEENTTPEHFVILTEQYRMEKEIADIANLYYEGVLETPIPPKNKKDEFNIWYNEIVNNNSTITIINTDSLNAWVTSVVRGGTSSRVNYMSATLCVNLAKHLTQSLINKKQTNNTKVLILSPYKPHAKRMELLLKDDDDIGDLIKTGTIHSFQGSEADIVIFDLVVDEPHWKVNLFMHDEKVDEQMRRLFNVAVTRAKFKLFVVGNIPYCLKKSKGSVLNELLEYLVVKKEYPVCDAKELFPKLYNDNVQNLIGGAIEAPHERMCCTQENYYDNLYFDIKKAKIRVIIYSAFMALDRMSKLLPYLQDAVERGLKVYVITKSTTERTKRDLPVYNQCENILRKNGIGIIYKKGMHEKLVFIDENIIWTGSLNTLSQSNSEEIMERRKNNDVFSDYAMQMKLDKLIGIIEKNETICPICGDEIIASEGSNEPFFWRCIKDQCYTRSVDQEYPKNGEITCKKCDSPVVYSMKNEPRWICTKDTKHFQKLFSAHLKLPKMEEKIPRGEIKKLRNYLEKREIERVRIKQLRT